MFVKFLKNNIYSYLLKNKKYGLLISHGCIMGMLSFCIYTIFKDQEIIHSIVSGTSTLSFYYYFFVRTDKKLLLPVSMYEIKNEIRKIKNEDKKEIFKKCLAQKINEGYLTQYDFIMIKEMIYSEDDEFENNKYFWLDKYNNKYKNEKMIKVKKSLDLLEDISVKEKVKI